MTIKLWKSVVLASGKNTLFFAFTARRKNWFPKTQKTMTQVLGNFMIYSGQKYKITPSNHQIS